MANKVINIVFKRIKVTGFSVKNMAVDLEIEFEDPTPKKIQRTTHMGDSKEEAGRIVDEVILMEERIHYKFDGETLRSGHAKVIIQDEQIIRREIASFLEQIRVNAHVVKSSRDAEGYISLVNKVLHKERKLD